MDEAASRTMPHCRIRLIRQPRCSMPTVHTAACSCTTRDGALAHRSECNGRVSEPSSGRCLVGALLSQLAPLWMLRVDEQGNVDIGYAHSCFASLTPWWHIATSPQPPTSCDACGAHANSAQRWAPLDVRHRHMSHSAMTAAHHPGTPPLGQWPRQAMVVQNGRGVAAASAVTSSQRAMRYHAQPRAADSVMMGAGMAPQSSGGCVCRRRSRRWRPRMSVPPSQPHSHVQPQSRLDRPHRRHMWRRQGGAWRRPTRTCASTAAAAAGRCVRRNQMVSVVTRHKVQARHGRPRWLAGSPATATATRDLADG